MHRPFGAQDLALNGRRYPSRDELCIGRGARVIVVSSPVERPGAREYRDARDPETSPAFVLARVRTGVPFRDPCCPGSGDEPRQHRRRIVVASHHEQPPCRRRDRDRIRGNPIVRQLGPAATPFKRRGGEPGGLAAALGALREPGRSRPAASNRSLAMSVRASASCRRRTDGPAPVPQRAARVPRHAHVSPIRPPGGVPFAEPETPWGPGCGGWRGRADHPPFWPMQGGGWVISSFLADALPRAAAATCQCAHARRCEALAPGAVQGSKEHSRLLRRCGGSRGALAPPSQGGARAGRPERDAARRAAR